MREILSKYVGKFVKVKAKVGISSWGKDFGYGERIKTLCLENVQVHSGPWFDHVWIKHSNHLIQFKLGDEIEFIAQVVQYQTSAKSDFGFATVRSAKRVENSALTLAAI